MRFLLLTMLLAACAPADQPLDEAGPQAGAVSLDVGVSEEPLLTCSDAQYCSGLKGAVQAYLNSSCGGGWSLPSGGCNSAWTSSAPGGRSSTAVKISTTQRYVTATQCSQFTVTCACSPQGTIGCTKN